MWVLDYTFSGVCCFMGFGFSVLGWVLTTLTSWFVLASIVICGFYLALMLPFGFGIVDVWGLGILGCDTADCLCVLVVVFVLGVVLTCGLGLCYCVVGFRALLVCICVLLLDFRFYY